MTRVGGGGGANSLRTAGGVIPYIGLLATAGDNIVVPGIAGRRIRLLWAAFIPAGSNTLDNLVTIKFESSATGMYLGYAMAHWESFPGAVGKGLVVNLANTQPVAVTLHYDTVSA